MNKRLFFKLLLVISLSSAGVMAQKNNHVGEWKLVSQKVTLTDGRIFQGDSTNIMQRKILTSQNQVIVIGERMIDGQRLAASVHGGYYTLNGNDYTEKLDYAAYKDYEKVKCNFQVTVKGDEIHQVGILEGADGVKTTYDEIYVRVRPPATSK